MRQIHTEGMRYTGAREYRVNDLPALLDILADEDEAMYWPNATMVLGAIGDGAAVEPLIKVVEGRHNEQPRSPCTVTYRGHWSGLFGLGLLAAPTHRRRQRPSSICSSRRDPRRGRSADDRRAPGREPARHPESPREPRARPVP